MNTFSLKFQIAHWNAKFYNFSSLITVDLTDLRNDSIDYSPTIIKDNEIENVFFNIGASTNIFCEIDSIICIKFKNDSNLYALSSSPSWLEDESGNNITFLGDNIMLFTPFDSKNPIGPKKLVGSITFKFECDLDGPFFSEFESINQNYEFVLTIKDFYSCQFPISIISQLFLYYSGFLIVMSLVSGVFLGIYGLKYFKINLFIISLLVGFFSGLALISLILYPDIKISFKYQALIFIGCIALGIILGFISVFNPKIGVFLLGESFGFILFLIIYVVFMEDLCPTYLLIGGITLGIIMGILAFIMFDQVIIFATSFAGSYLLIRALASVILHFPAEILLYQMMKSEEPLLNQCYIYVGSIAFLAGFLIIIQEIYKLKAKDEFEDKKRYVGLYIRHH